MTDSFVGRPYTVRLPDDYEDQVADVLENVARRHPNFASLSEAEAEIFRLRLDFASTNALSRVFPLYFSSERDPTGKAFRVIRFNRDDFERDMTRAAEELIGAGHEDPPEAQVS